MQQKGKKAGVILASALLVIAAAVMLFIYAKAKPDTNNRQDKSKIITVKVVIPEEETREYEIATDAAYLRQALDEEGMIEGTDNGFGFFITGVNGRSVEASKEEWWCITKEGEDVFYGVDEIAVEDGDQYELTLTIGY